MGSKNIMEPKGSLGAKAHETSIAMSDEDSINDSAFNKKRNSMKSKSRSVSTTSSFGPNVMQPGQIYIDKGRPKWPSEYDSLVCNIGSAVGLGNIAGFPLVAYRNGGTAFLIPYIILIIFGAFPIMYQQRILGQFVQQGCVSVWKIVPIFKGIGYATQLISILFICYYTITLAWTLIYIFETFNSTLSYTVCGNNWNTPACIIPTFASYSGKGNNTTLATAGREYFRGRILRLWPSEFADGVAQDEVLSDDIEPQNTTHKIFGLHSKLGSPVWDLTGCMLLIFFSYFLVLIFGTRLTRKVAWISVYPPYVILPILLFRVITLDGASDGLFELVNPDFGALLLPVTWARAAAFATLSTSAGDSTQMNLASLDHFNHNTYRDAVATCIVDTFINIIAALVMFCLIGNAAYTQNIPVKDLVGNLSEGSDLVFELFTDVVWHLSGARFFLLMFYIMLFLFGFSSVIPTIQAIMMGYMDEFKRWFPPETNSEQILNFTLTSWAFIGSLACCTRGGIWIFMFMNTYASSVSLAICIALQLIVVSWIWGLQDLCNAAHVMTGRKPGIYLRFCWKFVAPFIMGVQVVYGWKDVMGANLKYNMETAPAYVYTAGECIMLIPLIFIPSFAIYQLIYFPADTLKLRIKLLFHPENEHHDIRKGHSIMSRYSMSHIFYVGLFEDCKKKATRDSNKPKIHPAEQESKEHKASFNEDDEDDNEEEEERGDENLLEKDENLQHSDRHHPGHRPSEEHSKGKKSVHHDHGPSHLEQGQNLEDDPRPSIEQGRHHHKKKE